MVKPPGVCDLIGSIEALGEVSEFQVLSLIRSLRFRMIIFTEIYSSAFLCAQLEGTTSSTFRAQIDLHFIDLTLFIIFFEFSVVWTN